MGADIVVGTSQRFGVQPGFGGPHAGYMAVRAGLERQLPGRLVGVSIDADGSPAYRLALQTREQHIRREKATSNICTAQVLLAVMASMYAVYHGPEGLRGIAHRTHRFARLVAAGLERSGLHVVHEHFFDTVLVRVPGRAEKVLRAARGRGINLRHVDADTIGISTDEVTLRSNVEDVWASFGVEGVDIDALDALIVAEGDIGVPPELVRTSEFLTHPVFSSYRSETEMLRYLRRLQDKDVALDRSMIPLGSCTMKLNATTEMEAVTWPEFANIHPFAPLEQAQGYLELIDQLEEWLIAITGYDAVSLQPNAGSQGEFSGLLAIRAYHDSRGDHDRTICLVPASAHGTNAASAVMAGMKVVVVTYRRGRQPRHGRPHGQDRAAPRPARGADDHLPVDPRRLRSRGSRRLRPDSRRRRSGLRRRCEPQRAGRPGAARTFGADVSHLNLHKTFCIPHGGGGPGVGPVGGAFPPGARSCRTTRWWTRRGRRAESDRCPRRPGGRPGSCRSRGPTFASWVQTGSRRRRSRRCCRPTTSPTGSPRTTRCSTPATPAWWRTSASSTFARSPRRPASPSTTSPSG